MGFSDILKLISDYNTISRQSLLIVASTAFFYFSCSPENSKWGGGFLYSQIIEIFSGSCKDKFLKIYRVSFVILLCALIIISGFSILSDSISLYDAPPPIIIFIKRSFTLFNFILPGMVSLLGGLVIAIVLEKIFTKLVEGRINISKKTARIINFIIILTLTVIILNSLNSAMVEGSFIKPIEAEKFSWGEEILMRKELWKNGHPDCFEAHNKKEKAALDYKENENLVSANNNIKSFIDACKVDGEARIYHNNYSALESGKKLVKIAVSVPFSRDDSSPFLAQQILRGIAIAQERVNSNDLISSGDEMLLVGIADDGFDVNNKKVEERRSAKRVAKYIAEEEKNVLGVIGHFTSDSTEAASSIYANHSIVAISPTSTAIRSSISNVFDLSLTKPLNLSKYIFRTSPNDKAAIEELIDYIKNYNRKYSTLGNIGIIYEGESRYSSLYKETLEGELIKDEVLDLKVLNSPFKFNDLCSFHPTNNNRIKECLDSLKENGNTEEIDALVIIPSSEVAIYLDSDEDNPDPISLTLQNQNLQPVLFGGDAMYQEEIATKEREGMVIPVAFWQDPNILFGEQNDQINWRTAMSIDATLALAESYNDVPRKSSKSIKSIRKNIQKILSSKSFNGYLNMINKSNEPTVVFSNGDRKINSSIEKEIPTLVCIVSTDRGYTLKGLSKNELCPNP